jgi:CheY-like chemotaxis protein
MARVLIVEDDAAIRNAYTFILIKSGFHVDVAGDGYAALQLLRNKPDVILLDMLMPGLSGVEFLKQADIKRLHPHTKVIAISNIESPRVKEDAAAYGAERYLIKVSLTPGQVAQEVKDILGETGK